jgi:chemosensory pili system protein ChpA (sensor histidine kinase/response regulator)
MPAVALVVDDSMLIRYTVSRLLEKHGFTVESVGNGVEALEILNRMRPDLIVTDLQMPKMSGHELIAAVRSKPETAEIPIIIVASRPAGNNSGSQEFEKLANFLVYKDIDIEEQLDKALKALRGKTSAKKQSATK